VTQPSSAALRLFVEELPEEPAALALPQFASLARAFEQATGWRLRREQGAGSPGEVWAAPIEVFGRQRPTRLVVSAAELNDDSPPAIDLHQARPLALAVGGLLGELNRLRHELWQREAELAAGVPVAARPDEEPHLAERLESVIQSGAEAVGCQAAGLYLLDEHTSHLKLRAAWNLPPERLLAEPRPLRGAVADLEALVGHAVVLEDTTLLPHWRCPEPFPAAVCVPVSSPTVPLGTFWVFSEKGRDFSPHETNLVEIIAGRLAADLEREMLLAAGVQAKQEARQLDVAARWLSGRLPGVAPLVEGYDVAGWTQHAKEIGGTFHDWSVLPDGRLALAVGAATGQLSEAALGAASLHSAIKSHAGYRHDAAEMLSRVNDTLYAASPGDQRANLAYALIDPDRGQVKLALAGQVAAHILGSSRKSIAQSTGPQLGESPEGAFRAQKALLRPGESLLLLSGEVPARDSSAWIAKLSNHSRHSAAQIAEQLRLVLAGREPLKDDVAALVLTRRNAGTLISTGD
jgi:sigma-B regulation protein RsbU (phosphoserine phosphatase)